MAKSRQKSGDKRKQEHKYRVEIYAGWVNPLCNTGKTLGSLKEWVTGPMSRLVFVKESFEKAIIYKRQDDGSWKIAETITDLDS